MSTRRSPRQRRARFVPMSIPGRTDDEPTVWFVYDVDSMRNVQPASGFDDAAAKCKRLNRRRRAA